MHNQPQSTHRNTVKVRTPAGVSGNSTRHTHTHTHSCRLVPCSLRSLLSALLVVDELRPHVCQHLEYYKHQQ